MNLPKIKIRRRHWHKAGMIFVYSIVLASLVLSLTFRGY